MAPWMDQWNLMITQMGLSMALQCSSQKAWTKDLRNDFKAKLVSIMMGVPYNNS